MVWLVDYKCKSFIKMTPGFGQKLKVCVPVNDEKKLSVCTSLLHNNPGLSTTFQVAGKNFYVAG